jgi:hypothetical protein
MDDRWCRGERAGAALFSVMVLAGLLSPVLQYRRPPAERVDGFPLSWYPMFSAKRRRRAWITHAVGVDSAGRRRYLPLGALGAGGLNQVRRQLYRVAVRECRPHDCAGALAARVAGRHDCTDIVGVEVVRTRFDLDACLLGRHVHGESTVLAAARVAS